MQTVVGIFTSQAVAEQAAEQLCRLGIARDQIHFLVPGASLDRPEQVPTSDTEQPGMGSALGGCRWGGRWGAGGMMTASAQCPGARHWHRHGYRPCGSESPGPGGGAVAGAVAGGALEDTLANGLPKDELYVYKDALRRGRTVLMALVEDADQATAARAALAQAGQEVWMQRVRNGGLARVMQKPKLITPQVGISPGMKRYIDVALKLLSAPK